MGAHSWGAEGWGVQDMFQDKIMADPKDFP